MARAARDRGRRLPPNGEFDAYRPVTTASFAANYAIHGPAPLGYHVVNVALHAADAERLFPDDADVRRLRQSPGG